MVMFSFCILSVKNTTSVILTFNHYPQRSSQIGIDQYVVVNLKRHENPKLLFASA